MDHIGIRIHKVMGYGITDLQLDDEGNAIIDPRVSPEAADGEHLWDLKLTDYQRWLKEQSDDFVAEGGDLSRSEFATSDLIYMNYTEAAKERVAKDRATDYFTLLNGYDGEDYNGKGVLLVRPFAMDDWKRYADPIDYAEDGIWQQTKYGRYEGPVTNVQLLRSSPYPYDGRWWDVRTGQRVDSDTWIFIGNMLSMKEDPDRHRVVELLAQKLGYESYEEALCWVQPEVPSNVRHLLDWSGVLPNSEDYRSLRPMILTYWS